MRWRSAGTAAQPTCWHLLTSRHGRLCAETGEIYHLTFKPPPPEIVPRLVRPARLSEQCTSQAFDASAASRALEQRHAAAARFPGFLAQLVCRGAYLLATFLCVRLAWCSPCLQVQRSDDTEEKARNRLRTYHANVDAVIGYYKQQLVEVGSGWVAVVSWQL